MAELHIFIAGLTAIILFVYGLEAFSAEIQQISGERFRSFLGRSTRIPIAGVLIGAIVTAIIQSSSATSIITISLVNAGVLSFKNSVGIIFGANVGTTITAQLVAFKLTAFAPILIIAGFMLSLIKSRYSIFSKAIFYFGFVFFALNLISSSLAPLQSNETLVGFLNQPQNVFLAILAGCLFTAMVQSSSVTTGLAIIFTQQGILSLENAVPLIMGANIGTTATALIAIFNMDAAAKKTALSHFLFNVGGVLLFLPVLFISDNYLANYKGDAAVALAGIHMLFNIGTSLIFVLSVNPFTRLVERLIGEGKMDFERILLPPTNEKFIFEEHKSKLLDTQKQLLTFVQENYNLTSLSLETNFNSITEAAEKRLQYTDYLKKDITRYFSKAITLIDDEEQSKEIISLFNQFDYLFQIHDSTIDLFETKISLQQHYVELRSDTLNMVRSISGNTMELFSAIANSLFDINTCTEEIHRNSQELQRHIDQSNRSLLPLLIDTQRTDAGALVNFITYSQRIKDKLVNYAMRTQNSAIQ